MNIIPGYDDYEPPELCLPRCHIEVWQHTPGGLWDYRVIPADTREVLLYPKWPVKYFEQAVKYARRMAQEEGYRVTAVREIRHPLRRRTA